MYSSIYWKAVYKDGKSLTQFEEEKENKYPDIDRSKLAVFEIRKAAMDGQEDRVLFKLFLEPGRRLIYRRRVLKRYKFGKTGNPEPAGTEIIYLAGWQATIGGRSVQDIAYVFEDGHVELAGQWKEAPYDSISGPLPCETKCYDEKHFSADAVIVKRTEKAISADAILTKTEKEESK